MEAAYDQRPTEWPKCHEQRYSDQNTHKRDSDKGADLLLLTGWFILSDEGQMGEV